ncbi:hypothetical protein X777_10577 [Ooceraea biroi]|uniref:Uncharacterized protein n=1 Tax=Ooceraea biroi TaxID=2015173 RepID=A0A026W7E5_OOCBI|nr:hypothetical protein X777_10577 [Ooceraea biroi]
MNPYQYGIAIAGIWKRRGEDIQEQTVLVSYNFPVMARLRARRSPCSSVDFSFEVHGCSSL